MIPKEEIFNSIFEEGYNIERAYDNFFYFGRDKDHVEFIFDSNLNYIATLQTGIESWGDGLAGGWEMKLNNGELEETELYILFHVENQKMVNCPPITQAPMYSSEQRQVLWLKIDEWDDDGSNEIEMTQDGHWGYIPNDEPDDMEYDND